MVLGRQPVTRGRELGWGGVSLGQRREGRVWDHLSECERRGCRRRRRRTEGRKERCGVLLPASQVLEDSVNLFFLAESLKERQQVQELRVIHIVKPRLDRDLKRWENHLQLAGIPHYHEHWIQTREQKPNNSRNSQRFLGGKCKRRANCPR